MGEVIKFPVERVRRTTGQSVGTEGNAEVLVFEGVRYSALDQSHEEAVARPAAEPGS